MGPVARRIAEAAVRICVVGLVGALVASWIPVFPCVLLEHFRVQYAVGGLVLTAAAAAVRTRGYFDAAAIATLLHSLPVLGDLGRSPQPVPVGGVPVRVLVLNVLTENTNTAAVRALFEEERPDVIGLVEVNQRWIDELAPALAPYEGRLARPLDDNFGIALFARGAATGTIEELGAPLPTIVGHVTIGRATFTTIVAHLFPPMSRTWSAYQAAQVAMVAERARALPDPVLVIGDFNATPWSAPFRALVSDTGLCDSRAGFGIQASFPASFAPLRIPIDHVLASCSVGVRDRRIGPAVGSDHLPVIVDVVVPARPD